MSWYTKKANVGEDPNEYEANVEVSVYHPSSSTQEYYEIEAGKVTIKFRIDIEARLWGIKSILVYLQGGNISVPISITRGDDNQPSETRNIVVDLSKIQVHESTGNNVITLGELELYIDSNFNVDYKNSYLEILK